MPDRSWVHVQLSSTLNSLYTLHHEPMEDLSLQLLMSAWDLSEEILFSSASHGEKTREAFCQLLGRSWMKRTKGQVWADLISSLQVWQKPGVSQSQRNYLSHGCIERNTDTSSVQMSPERETTLVLCCWQLFCGISRRKGENGIHCRSLFYC